MQISEFTEFIATSFAIIGIVFGMGATFHKGYQKGTCLLPAVMIFWVCIPMCIATMFRAITFWLDNAYWFFITIDVMASVILAGTICQYYGLFLKQQSKSQISQNG